jgi:carboxylate-amine ligase
MPRKFYWNAKAQLKDCPSSEMLRCQIEVMTPPCASMIDARRELARLRGALSDQAARYGLGIMAASTHPTALWREQKQTPKDRYSTVMSDIQMLGLRVCAICFAACMFTSNFPIPTAGSKSCIGCFHFCGYWSR